MYAVEVGRMYITSETAISEELRKEMLEAVRQALAGLDGEISEGVRITFSVTET